MHTSKEQQQKSYKPHTITEYRKIKQDKYVELGKLQPDLLTPELIAKREKVQKMKDFAKNANSANRKQVSE